MFTEVARFAGQALFFDYEWPYVIDLDRFSATFSVLFWARIGFEVSGYFAWNALDVGFLIETSFPIEYGVAHE